ncbi:unnamed protein product, partial [Allacma fusca]
MRVPHVFDPDEEECASIDEETGKGTQSSSYASSEAVVVDQGDRDKDQRSSDSGSEKSEIAVGVRNAIEHLREKYGEENWLLKQAGVEVGKLLKIPVVVPSSNKVSASVLSQSLPSPGAFHKSNSTNSFYSTAVDDGKMFSPELIITGD